MEWRARLTGVLLTLAGVGVVLAALLNEPPDTSAWRYPLDFLRAAAGVVGARFAQVGLRLTLAKPSAMP